MLLILVDEDLPRSTAKYLRQLHFDVEDVRDIGLRGKSDEEIMDYARKRNAIVITADRGFGNINRFPLGSHSGIIVLRIGNEFTDQMFETFILRNVTDVTQKRKITAISPLRGFNCFAIVPCYKYVAPIGAFCITYNWLYVDHCLM